MTVLEVNQKQAKLQAEMATALEAAKVLIPATPEFDEAYGRYLGAKSGLAKIPTELAVATKAEHADAIKADGVTMAQSIKQLIDGLGIDAKLGEPVKKLVYDVFESGPAVTFNPTVTVRATKAGKGEPKAGGRTVAKLPDGSTMSLTKFVLEHATEAEKASPEYKYPHGVVSSKPKFEAFCAVHGLTGYEYVIPGKAES